MFKRSSCAAAVLCLMACSKPTPPNPDSCGGELCNEAQRCDAPTLLCVTNESPKIVLESPTTVISDETFELKGTVTDDTEGTTLEWKDGVAEWQSVELSADGSFTITVPARALDSEPMHLTVRADDGTTQSERQTLVIVDRVGPKIELKSPSSGAVSGGSEVMVSVIVRDGSEGLQELRIDSQNISAPRTGTEHRAPVSIPPGDRRNIPVTVFAKDLNGNRATQTFMVTVDGVGPSIRFLTPTAQTINTPTFRVQVEATDLSEVNQVRLSMDDGGFVDAAQDGGTWSAEFSLPAVEQPVNFSAEATDGAGNKSVLSTTAQLDRVAPTVEITGPSADSILAQGFAVTVLAGADAVSVTATFAGSTIPLTRGVANSWEGQMPLSVTGDYAAEPLVAVARDAAGNQRASAPRQLFIDTVAPTITFTSPAASAKLNAANFVASEDVIVTWQVRDGDPQAATVSVDGVPSIANDVRVTTASSDNGRAITKTVVAVDRRGNVATASLTFSVDRLAPTVVTWLPGANARNVEPRTTTVTFSERVSGPTTSSDALNISGVTQPGTWDSAHSSWTSVALSPYAVFTATLANLADDSGNPVSVTSRKFHTAALVPASGTVLASNVTRFQVTSDTDGVVTIATISAAGYRVFGLSPTTGAVQSPSLSDPNPGTIRLNSSLTVDPSTLIATHRVGSARYGGVGSGPLVPVGLVRHLISDGVASPVGSTADAGGTIVSRGAFNGETDSTAYGLIDGTTYRRGSVTRTLGVTADVLVAQSNNTWAGFSLPSAGRIAWSRFLCIPSNLPGAPTVCQSFNFDFNLTPLSNVTDLSAAISPSGRCMAVMASDNGARAGNFLPLAYCNELRVAGSPLHPSCQNTSYAALPMASYRVAPFGGNGEDNVLGAYAVSGVPRLQKMSNAVGCTGFDTNIGAPAPEVALAYEPVQLGNKAAILYTDVNNTLKLFVP